MLLFTPVQPTTEPLNAGVHAIGYC